MISTISHYRIIKLLGAGGMGEVYLAQDTRLNRPVALKLLSANLASNAKQLRRFRQEAMIAAALHHPNVCIIHEVGETPDGQPFIAMEYIEGQTLAAKINQQPLELSALLTFAIQIADALEEAHSKGIIHRDLKPANILITTRNQAKVLDFGLAKLTAPVEALPVSDLSTQPKTESGTVMGTVTYMSPEQAMGKELDSRSDLFSLGIVLYEMATGRLPFVGATRTEILDRILHAQPEAVARFNYNAPAELERIIRKCLEKEPECRYQSAKELMVDLRNLKRHSDFRAEPPHSYSATPEVTKPYDTTIEVTKEVSATAANAARTTATDGRFGWRTAVTSRRSLVIALALVLLLGGLAYALFWRMPVIVEQPKIKSLAVLPLENLSGDPAQEYFADGMTEALISNLAQIRALKVISRTSVMRYKGSGKSLPEIARELNVDAVLEGSVRRAGGRVRITAQLIHAANDTHLWARDYEREMTDVLKLESEVARTVADEIRIQVTLDERRRLASARSVDPQAHDAYLLGRYHLSKLNPEDLKQAVENFDRAIQLAPDYAAAYAGLSEAWRQRGIWGAKTFSEVEAPARAAVLNALRLDELLAEGHISLAMLKYNFDWDWIGAEQEFRRALELDPSGPVHRPYADFLMALGRHADAISEIQRAEQSDPLSSEIQSTYGRILYRARKYEEAIPHFERALELEPRNYSAYIRLGDIYAITGRYAEALAEFEKASQLRSDGMHPARIARVYALMGKTREARQMIRGVKAPAFDLVGIYVALGDKDEAFKILEQAVEARDSLLVHLKEDPTFDNLHTDPRWESLLRRMNFPPE